MFQFKKLISRLERRFDASLEKFVLHHQILGLILVFMGMPLLTLASVCVLTTAIILPVSMATGWL